MNSIFSIGEILIQLSRTEAPPPLILTGVPAYRRFAGDADGAAVWPRSFPEPS